MCVHGGQLSRFVFSGPVGFGLMCLYSSHLFYHFRMVEGSFSLFFRRFLRLGSFLFFNETKREEHGAASQLVSGIEVVRWQIYPCTVRRFTFCCPQHRFVKHQSLCLGGCAKIGKFRISTDLWDFWLGYFVLKQNTPPCWKQISKENSYEITRGISFFFSDLSSTSPAEHLTSPPPPLLLQLWFVASLFLDLKSHQKATRYQWCGGKKETK